MRNFIQLIIVAFKQSLLELKANKLRTGLSLTGITIGIFSIIAVLTVMDSMRKNIENEMSSLGNDVIYFNRWPWMDDGGQYKWWEYVNRPSMTKNELKSVENNLNIAKKVSLSYPYNTKLKYRDVEISGITVFGVTNNFDKIQNLELKDGRYLSISELDAGSPCIVLGHDLYEELFGGNISALQKKVNIDGRLFNIVGILKKLGTTNSGFDFDNSGIIPYNALYGIADLKSLNVDPYLMVQAHDQYPIEEVRYQTEGLLRSSRKIQPGQGNNFAINELNSLNERVDEIFAMLNSIGALIGGFALVVGGFGIANIMFVSVKERTKIIGLKKAIGAKRASIMTEFVLEAIILCIIGGLLGLVLVAILGVAMTYGADFPITMSINNVIFGIGISALIGLLSGIIPAYTASRLNAVTAIRSI